MDHYINVRLLPDPEFPPDFLMGALYSKLHRTLYDLEADDIGISFPEHKEGVRKRTLGTLLRLHANRQRLMHLLDTTWLKGMHDHVQVSEIQVVPDDVTYRTVTRKQFNTGGESRAKRYAKRHEIPIEEARELYAKVAARRIELPFAKISSRSTGQRFSLFIEHGHERREPLSGTFNHYGLSSSATVPWF